MKRWDFSEMQTLGRSLFAKVHRQKRFASPNHEVHFMARELDDWLVQGIHSIMDDVLILCQTKRQLNRCKQRLMTVLKERRLSLSSKKTRIGRIDKGFHFLGIQYLGTQPPDNTTVPQAHSRSVPQCSNAHKLTEKKGGVNTTNPQLPEQSRIVPHPRTLRKARESVCQMVITEVSPLRIRAYLNRWCRWWVRTTELWSYQELLEWFLHACWEPNPAAIYATGLLHWARKSFDETSGFLPIFGLAALAAL